MLIPGGTDNCVNGIYSDPFALMYGVLQGSALGPILFVLYTTTVSDLINYLSLHHESFADDTQLHKSAHIPDMTKLSQEYKIASQTSKHGWFITNYSSMITKRNLCSLHLDSFATIFLSLLCRPIKSIFLLLHLFAASVTSSTKHCLSSSMS